MLKKFLVLILFVQLTSGYSQQDATWIYGIEDQGISYGYLVRLNYQTGEYDTLIDLGGVYIQSFKSCIDPFNGRYIFFGSTSGLPGNLHVVNLNTLDIQSYNTTLPEMPEYNIFTNSIISISNEGFYSYHLDDNTLTIKVFQEISTRGILGKVRVYNPVDNTFVCLQIDGEICYYFVYNASSGDFICKTPVPFQNNHQIPPADMVVDYETGTLYGKYNNLILRFNPYTALTETLLTIPNYYSALNDQISTYDQINKKYIVPYVAPGYIRKIAVIDMVNFLIDTIYLQPSQWMDEHQIYCMPQTYLRQFDEVLVSSYGQDYTWFRDGFAIPGGKEHFLVPYSQGEYQVLTEYPLYSSLSDPLYFYFTGITGEIKMEDNRIFPNPFSDNITVEFADLKPGCRLKIFNSNGALVYSENLVKNKSTLNLNSLPPGIYLFCIEENNTSNKIAKSIKLH